MSYWPQILTIILLVPLSVGVTRLMILLGPKLGLVDHPDERRIHKSVIPRSGGVGIYVTMIVGMGILAMLGGTGGSEGVLTGRWLACFSIASAILLVVGVVDDRGGVSAWIKLGAQTLAAAVMFFHNPAGAGILMGYQVPWVVDFGVHVFWVVALINAFNLIDGMDGLCAGLGLISLSILSALAVAKGDVANALMLAVMAAALLGFLRYNFHPARIFLGDTGSMLVGFFIAVVGTATVGRHVTVAGLLLPLLVGGVPLLDVGLAVWRRGARRLAVSKPGQAGIKIFGPDRDHLHHRILSWGFTQRQTALLIYTFAVVISVIGLLPVLGGANFITISAVGLVMIGLVGLRYIAPVEFLASGHGLRTLIRRPRSARLVIFAYFLYDLACLIAASALAWWLVSKTMREPMVPDEWLGRVMVFSVCCILGLRFARAHSRSWTRSSVHDFAETLIWMTCGMGLSFAILSFTRMDFSFRDAVFHLSAGAMALTLIFLPRSVGFYLQESVIDTMHRKRRLNSKRAGRTSLVYGAGDLGELFVCHLRLSQPDTWQNDHFLGFIDDNGSLSGRRLRGFPVLGRLEELKGIVERAGVNSVLIAVTRLGEAQKERLEALAEELDLELRTWQPGLDPVTVREGLIPKPVERPEKERVDSVEGISVTDSTTA